jgi:aspartyl/asparaginyl beta-hydroxylase (cupin superfamily)
MRLACSLDLPRLGAISPSLYFSVLEPKSRIAPHTGITNARVIAHLPLIVPENCGFRVGGETRQWQVGKAMVFDDMTTHEAWNDSDETRVVLIADLWRPELGAAERSGVEELMDCTGLAPSS